MPRATPNDVYPDKTRMVQLVDLYAHGYLPEELSETEIGEECYYRLPMDFPGHLRIIRRVDSTKDGHAASLDHLATTVEVTMDNGARVWLKWDRQKNAFVVSTQGPEESKPRKMKTWT